MDRTILFKNEAEIDRIRQELGHKIEVLNKISSFNSETIQQVTASETAIDNFIFTKHLRSNPELQRMEKAGIDVRIIPVMFSPELLELKSILKTWYHIRGKVGRYRELQQNDFVHLFFSEGKWSIDEVSLETEFIRKELLIYCNEEQSKWMEFLEGACEFLNERVPSLDHKKLLVGVLFHLDDSKLTPNKSFVQHGWSGNIRNPWTDRRREDEKENVAELAMSVLGNVIKKKVG